MQPVPSAADDRDRRIAQLEAALARRSELVERQFALLAAVQGSLAWKVIRALDRWRDRLLPPHSRRREALKGTLRAARHVAGRLLGRHGPPRTDTAGPDPATYRRWARRYEPTPADLLRQRSHRFARRPLVSVLVPVYNTPEPFLKAMLESVLTQTYDRWELCLADGASTDPRVAPVLQRYARTDPRVKVRHLPANEGIAGNSNAALEMAAGEYVALLDHDDTLAPFALFEVVRALNEQPDADLIYSDEDKLDPSGRRVSPVFKPDWSPEALRSHNYVCHLAVYRRSLLAEIGGFRPGFDGAQDYDLVLRAGEKARRIVHVPQVLYHWRMHAESTAFDPRCKSDAAEAGRRALADHYRRLGTDAAVEHGPRPGTYRTWYRLTHQPLVSAIVPNRDAPELLARCLASLADSTYANHEILVVENGSTRPETLATYRRLRAQPHARVLEWDRPFNYAAVNNHAAARARGDLLLFLNNDVEAINPDWLERMVAHVLQPGVAAVGAKLYFPDDTVQHAGIVLGMGGVAGHSHLQFPRQSPGYANRLLVTQNCAAVTGACLLVRRDAFEAVGGFDEGFALAYNDVDLCLELLERGYRVVWTPDAELYHRESATRGPEDTPSKRDRFWREYRLFQCKWQERLRRGDPYYSPHLRLDRPDFMTRG